MRCEPVPFAEAGEPCGPDTLPKLVKCATGTACTLVSDTTDAGVSSRYTCEGFIEDRMTCTGNFEHDNPCKTPDSRCFHDTCRPNGPAECAAARVLP